jgi:hypothetical protein
MFGVAIRQALGMKLYCQQERKEARRLGLQFHALHNSIVGCPGHLQRLGDPAHSLMVRAVHAQYSLTDDLGQ